MVGAGTEYGRASNDGARLPQGNGNSAETVVSAELAARIIESMPMALAVIDGDLRCRGLNAQAGTLIGRPREQIIGRSLTDIFPGAIGGRYDQAARKALADRVPFEYELYHPPTDAWYENHSVPVDEELWTFFRDITKRKRAELRLEAQHAVTRALAQSESLAQAMPEILRSLCESLGWELVQLWTIDEQAHQLRMVEAWWSPEVDVADFSSASREIGFEPASGLPGRVWASGKPAWIADVTTDNNFPRAAAAREAGLHGALAFPIRLNAEVLAIIEFFTRSTREPDPNMLEMIDAIGSQIGQFIERAEGAEAVRRNEARKSAIVETALDAVISMDHEGRVVEFNPAAERTFGYEHEEVVGKYLADLIIPPHLRAEHRQGLARYLATGEAPVLGKRIELSGVRSDGTEFPVELTVTKVDLPGPPLFTGYIRDLTDSKQAQEGVSRLAAIVKSSDDAIIGKTLEGVITSWNAGAERLYGYPADEAVGQPISMLIPSDRPDESASILRRIALGQSINHFQTVRVAKDGARIDVSVTISPIHDHSGVITGASTIARDITEQKRAEAERAGLLDRERAVRTEAERATRRLQRLQRVTDVALTHLELDKLLEELLHRTRDLLQADTATILLLEDPETLVVRASSGLESEVEAGVRVRVGEGIAGRIAATREPLVVKDVSRVLIASQVLKNNLSCLIGAPLINQNELLGVIHLGAFSTREFTEEDLQLIELAAERAAQAIGRARSFEAERSARADAETIQARLAFLAEASRVLSSSLEYQTTLSRVADLAVPQFADWCTVDVLEDDGAIRPVALAHKDPEKVKWARELQRKYPPDPDAPTGVPNVLRTGQPELYPVITEEMLAVVTDPEMLDIIRQIGMTSIMVVPLLARERIVGAMTFVSAESEHQFGPDHLELAQELARRAAQAIDNARLFGEAQSKTAEVEQLNAELEQRVADRTAQLEEANRELEGFSYSVSHDLRAPLRVIDGFSRILLNEYGPQLPEEAGRYIDLVRDGANQMGQLIDDLLVYAKLGRQSLKEQVVDPGELVRACMENLRPQQDDRQVEVDIGDLPKCHGDPVLLKQVFLNLMDNALKYTRTRPVTRIEVGFRPDESGQPVYFVRDNGVGFDMKFADKLFGVFQRMHKAEDYEGTGVGLAIVQRAIHRHGGRVWAEAAMDVGATFYFTLGGGDTI
jgi:PAS domain S-box-containing protein